MRAARVELRRDGEGGRCVAEVPQGDRVPLGEVAVELGKAEVQRGRRPCRRARRPGSGPRAAPERGPCRPRRSRSRRSGRGRRCSTTAAFQYLTRLHDGCACFTSAATPAVVGAAIEVPDMVAERFPVPIPTEAIADSGPGQVGLEPAVARARPERAEAREAQVARVRERRVGHRRRLAVGGDQRRARARRHAEERDRDGVRLAGVRVLGDLALERRERRPCCSPSRTAAAPACWPKIARATRAQVPTTRRVTTSFPGDPVYSAGLQPLLITPSGWRRAP